MSSWRRTVTSQLIQDLHVGIQGHDGFALGVATGGFKSPAIDVKTKLMTYECRFCEESVVPMFLGRAKAFLTYAAAWRLRHSWPAGPTQKAHFGAH